MSPITHHSSLVTELCYNLAHHTHVHVQEAVAQHYFRRRSAYPRSAHSIPAVARFRSSLRAVTPPLHARRHTRGASRAISRSAFHLSPVFGTKIALAGCKNTHVQTFVALEEEVYDAAGYRSDYTR